MGHSVTSNYFLSDTPPTNPPYYPCQPWRLRVIRNLAACFHKPLSRCSKALVVRWLLAHLHHSGHETAKLVEIFNPANGIFEILCRRVAQNIFLQGAPAVVLDDMHASIDNGHASLKVVLGYIHFRLNPGVNGVVKRVVVVCGGCYFFRVIRNPFS